MLVPGESTFTEDRRGLGEKTLKKLSRHRFVKCLSKSKCCQGRFHQSRADIMLREVTDRT